MKTKEQALETIQERIEEDWRETLSSMEYYLSGLDRDIDEGTRMNALLIRDWCREIEQLLVDLRQSMQSVGEPEWFKDKDHEQLADFRDRVDQLYLKCKNVIGDVH